MMRELRKIGAFTFLSCWLVRLSHISDAIAIALADAIAIALAATIAIVLADAMAKC